MTALLLALMVLGAADSSEWIDTGPTQIIDEVHAPDEGRTYTFPVAGSIRAKPGEVIGRCYLLLYEDSRCALVCGEVEVMTMGPPCVPVR